MNSWIRSAVGANPCGVEQNSPSGRSSIERSEDRVIVRATQRGGEDATGGESGLGCEVTCRGKVRDRPECGQKGNSDEGEASR